MSVFRLLGLALLCGAAPVLAQPATQPAAQATEEAAGPAVAPDPLPGLLQERALLTRQHAAANAQRNSLFGNKASKKDLQEVVDALQGIVDKDQQIVDELERTATAARTTARAAQTTAQHYGTVAATLETTSRDDRNLTSQRLAEVQNDLANARQREKKLQLEHRDLASEAADARQGRQVRDGLIAALAVACAGLVVLRLRRK